MPANAFRVEFRNDWLPNITDAGLARLIELLSTHSPLLIHGQFTSALPQGCPASHAAWHHPKTRHLMDDAGIVWLTRVAHLNPGTSVVLQTWDQARETPWTVREPLLTLCQAEQSCRNRPFNSGRRPSLSLS
jgi:hypothetical protein